MLRSRLLSGMRALMACTVLFGAACGGGAGDGPPVAPPPPADAISAVTVTPSSSALVVGASVTLVPNATTAGAGVVLNYTYASSAPAVATVSASGAVTAVGVGSAAITVTATGSGSGFATSTRQAVATIAVTAPPPALTELTVSPDGAPLSTGDTLRLTSTATTAASGVNVTYAYASSAATVASVDSRGVISAVSPGTATITVTAAGSGSGFTTTTLQAQSVVQVFALPPALSDLAVSPTNAALTTGDSVRIAVALTTAGQDVSVSYTYISSAPSVASVNNRGAISAASPGMASITVRATGSGRGVATNSLERVVSVTVTAPAVPQWRRVAEHPGESWAARWGDWTVAAGRLWVVENERSSTSAPRIHHSVDCLSWQTLDARTLGLPDLDIGSDFWGGNTTLQTGTDREVVIATTLVAPLTAEGNTPHRTQPWVLRGTIGNWTVQGPANTPGLNPRQIAGANGLEFSASAMTGATASWGDRVVLLPRGIWWRPGATTDQSFLSLTSAASGSWQLFAQRGYPWGVDSFQWMTGAAGTPWGFFAVGHVGFQTAFWFSADGHRWDVVPDPVSDFGGSRNRSAQVWSSAMMYGANGLVMARVRDVTTPQAASQMVAWRTTNGQQWQESVIADVVYGDVQEFATTSHYVVAVPQTSQSSDRQLRHVWVSRDAQRWVRIPEGPTFTNIIGLGSRLWGFRAGAVWELDSSSVRE